MFIPVADELDVYADNEPTVEVGSVRISVFTKTNYILLIRKITNALLDAEFDITDRRFVERESGTNYNHYAIDCEKSYDFNLEED